MTTPKRKPQLPRSGRFAASRKETHSTQNGGEKKRESDMLNHSPF